MLTAAGRQKLLLLAIFIAAGMIIAVIAEGCWPRPFETSRFAEFEPMALDINASHWAQLTMLDGVGVATARRIDEERERGGTFASADELARRVRGISVAAAERMWIAAPPQD